MARRKIEDEEEARGCLAAIEAEGGDIRAWAREHGVDGRSLGAWRVNLARWRGKPASAGKALRRRTKRSAQALGLVELVPRAMQMAPNAGRYVLEVAGGRVEFGDGFSEATLRRVIGVLRSC